jgi:hypothetical protein
MCGLYLLVFKNSILFYGKKERGKKDFKQKKNEDTNYKNQNRKINIKNEGKIFIPRNEVKEI